MSAARDPHTPDFRRSHIVDDETAVTDVVLDAMAGEPTRGYGRS